MTNKRRSKQYRDYPQNVPVKLFRLLRRNNFDRASTAKARNVNPGYLSLLLNKGIEPPDTTAKGRAARKALFLSARKAKPERVTYAVRSEPEYMSKWRHLSKEQRHTFIRQAIRYLEQGGKIGNTVSRTNPPK